MPEPESSTLQPGNGNRAMEKIRANGWQTFSPIWDQTFNFFNSFTPTHPKAKPFRTVFSAECITQIALLGPETGYFGLVETTRPSFNKPLEKQYDQKLKDRLDGARLAEQGVGGDPTDLPLQHIENFKKYKEYRKNRENSAAKGCKDPYEDDYVVDRLRSEQNPKMGTDQVKEEELNKIAALRGEYDTQRTANNNLIGLVNNAFAYLKTSGHTVPEKEIPEMQKQIRMAIIERCQSPTTETQPSPDHDQAAIARFNALSPEERETLSFSIAKAIVDSRGKVEDLRKQSDPTIVDCSKAKEAVCQMIQQSTIFDEKPKVEATKDNPKDTTPQPDSTLKAESTQLAQKSFMNLFRRSNQEPTVAATFTTSTTQIAARPQKNQQR